MPNWSLLYKEYQMRGITSVGTFQGSYHRGMKYKVAYRPRYKSGEGGKTQKFEEEGLVSLVEI